MDIEDFAALLVLVLSHVQNLILLNPLQSSNQAPGTVIQVLLVVQVLPIRPERRVVVVFFVRVLAVERVVALIIRKIVFSHVFYLVVQFLLFRLLLFRQFASTW